MMITVDPAEMAVAAETLLSCAAEAADIGSALWSCAQCAMPPDIQGAISQLVSAVDRALDSVGAQLDLRAKELAERGLIALRDSLVAAIAASGLGGAIGGMAPGTSVITSQGSVAEQAFGLTVGGVWGNDVTIDSPGLLGTATIGGTSLNEGFTIVPGTWLSPLTIEATPPTAGFTIDPGTWLGPLTVGGTATGYGFVDPVFGLTTASIGGGTTGAPFDGVLALAQASDNINRRINAQINAIVSNPNSSQYEIGVAHRALDAQGAATTHLLAPSRQSLDDQYGYHLTDSEVAMISPATLAPPITNILIPDFP